ncbi:MULTISPECIES: trypsin-like serine peptidase [Streptomyces]|uniref:Trypsin-like peptidase domain-containing protein n=1 Tax=Streptomyces bugieae TaxID=3098223 RepID=A0ABU7NXA6_9ACTN|nr:trypsin-like peptidase domain-containing protein [Streptomyces nigrescens]MEE4423504.1 trypsin-like peptidase domain-containing protein [Streptomyces sp. DSM 41528]
MALPEGAFVGLPLESTELHEFGSLKAPKELLSSYCPPWQPLLDYPRSAGEASQTTLSRMNGSPVIGTADGLYGEFAPRQAYYPTGFPFVCIGKVFSYSDVSLPTWDHAAVGFLVGPRTVMTVSHVLPWGSTNAKVQFAAGYYDGTSSVGPGAWSWATSMHGYAGQSVTAHDMAILRLSDPLGNWLGYFGSHPYDSAMQGGAYWNMAGYPSDIFSGERPSWQGGITVRDDDEDGDGQEIEHHGDGQPGASGAPFWGRWDDHRLAIGTETGYEKVSGPLGIGGEDNNIAAGGPAFGGLVQYGRDNWP